jgi:DNA primase
LIEGLNKNELYSPSYLKRMEDQSIVVFVTDIESQDQELSAKWFSKYNIVTRSEGDRMNELVMNAIYSFKSAKIEEKIIFIRKQLEKADELEDTELMDLLAEQMAYEKIKIIFAEKLGRIILR